jgi:chromosome segregation ATPase
MTCNVARTTDPKPVQKPKSLLDRLIDKLWPLKNPPPPEEHPWTIENFSLKATNQRLLTENADLKRDLSELKRGNLMLERDNSANREHLLNTLLDRDRLDSQVKVLFPQVKELTQSIESVSAELEAIAAELETATALNLKQARKIARLEKDLSEIRLPRTYRKTKVK